MERLCSILLCVFLTPFSLSSQEGLYKKGTDVSAKAEPKTNKDAPSTHPPAKRDQILKYRWLNKNEIQFGSPEISPSQNYLPNTANPRSIFESRNNHRLPVFIDSATMTGNIYTSVLSWTFACIIFIRYTITDIYTAHETELVAFACAFEYQVLKILPCELSG